MLQHFTTPTVLLSLNSKRTTSSQLQHKTYDFTGECRVFKYLCSVVVPGPVQDKWAPVFHEIITTSWSFFLYAKPYILKSPPYPTMYFRAMSALNIQVAVKFPGTGFLNLNTWGNISIEQFNKLCVIRRKHVCTKTN